MRTLIVRLALTSVLVLLTRWLGWPAPAVLGAVIAVLATVPTFPRAPAREAVLAAVLGWGALVAWPLVGGRGGTVASLIGGVTGMRGGAASGATAVVAGLTLALGVVLAWGAATLTAWLLRVLGVGSRASRPDGVTLSPTVESPPAPVTPANAGGARVPAAQTP